MINHYLNQLFQVKWSNSHKKCNLFILHINKDKVSQASKYKANKMKTKKQFKILKFKM